MTLAVASRRTFTATSLFVVALTALLGAQQPTFRSSVDVTAIDVIVVDGTGRPVTDLSASDFRVHVDGKQRRVVTARWVAQTALGRNVTIPEPIQGYSTNEGTIDGRLILFAVDQPNLRFGSLAGVRPAVNAFIDRLEPSDRMAVVALGNGVSTPITTDRARVKAAFEGMSAEIRSVEDVTSFNIAVSEALEVTNNNNGAWVEIAVRECGAPPPAGVIEAGTCWDYLLRDTIRISDEAVDSSHRTFAALRGLLDSLKKVDGPKTLVVISEGFLLANQGSSVATDLGPAAAAAQTTIYIMKVDDAGTDSAMGRPSPKPIDDRRIRRDGAELVASVARGEVFDVYGAGESALRQIEKEVAGYYLLGVESVPTDRDGKSHPIRVEVQRRGAVVRARTELVKPIVPQKTPNEDLVRALSSPFSASGLPLRITTFPFRAGDGPNIQLLIHAEAGSGYTAQTPVSIGYVISDAKGKVVEKIAGTATLPPATPGAPSPLFYTNGVTLPPGDYMMKFAVTEGDRIGSVDHLIHAGLEDAGAGRVSDLVVGGPPDDNEPQRPSIGYDVSFGRVQGYIEAYGRDVNDWMTTYEVSSNPDGPPLLSVGVPGRVTGDGRMVFSKTLPVNDLAPGKYYLRAALQSSERSLKTVSRQFRISPALPSVTSAAATVFALAPRSAKLPVSSAVLAPAFVKAQAFGETLDHFRRTVVPAARTPFDAGTGALNRGDFAEAQQHFRAAVQPAFAGANNIAPLAYLGVVSAMSGNDAEAVSIWQTALTIGAGLPDVYEWVGQAYLRLGQLPQARTAFAEGAAKWPSDPRFSRLLAMVYANLSQSRDALQSIAAYLAQRPADTDFLAMGVEWIYRAHASGAPASDEEKALARKWSDAYERAKGLDIAGVRHWLQLIETDTVDTTAANPI